MLILCISTTIHSLTIQMAIEIPRMNRFLGGKNRREGVGSTICPRKGNRESINIKERERERVI